MKIIKSILYGFLVFLFFALIFFIWIAIQEVQDTEAWAETVVAVEVNRPYHNEVYERARHYHGNPLVTKYIDGEWKFLRDGQWISLYKTIPEGKR